jgi:hypothetical protein
MRIYKKSVPTPQSIRKAQQRLNRLRREAYAVLAAMHRGATLHHAASEWWLATGRPVSAEVVNVVKLDRHVVGVGDALFGREFSQTWRWSE